MSIWQVYLAHQTKVGRPASDPREISSDDHSNECSFVISISMSISGPEKSWNRRVGHREISIKIVVPSPSMPLTGQISATKILSVIIISNHIYPSCFNFSRNLKTPLLLHSPFSLLTPFHIDMVVDYLNHHLPVREFV